MWDQLSQAGSNRRRSAQWRTPAHVLASKAEKMMGREPSRERHAATGQALHFGIGIALAIGYAFLRDKLRGKSVARGLMFGGGLFLMQDEAMNRMTGVGEKPRDYPWQAHARGLIAHLIYGVVMEMTLNAMEKSARRLAGSYERPNGMGRGSARMAEAAG